MTHEQVKAQLAEVERRVAYLTGKMEVTYEGLPRDEALIAESMKETGASRERVVQSLKAISERELAALRDKSPAMPEAVVDPAVKKFREMLG